MQAVGHATLLALQTHSHSAISARRTSPHLTWQQTTYLSNTNKLLIRCAWTGSTAFANAGYDDSNWVSESCPPPPSLPAPPPAPPSPAPPSLPPPPPHALHAEVASLQVKMASMEAEMASLQAEKASLQAEKASMQAEKASMQAEMAQCAADKSQAGTIQVVFV